MLQELKDHLTILRTDIRNRYRLRDRKWLTAGGRIEVSSQSRRQVKRGATIIFHVGLSLGSVPLPLEYPQ